MFLVAPPPLVWARYSEANPTLCAKGHLSFSVIRLFPPFFIPYNEACLLIWTQCRELENILTLYAKGYTLFGVIRYS